MSELCITITQFFFLYSIHNSVKASFKIYSTYIQTIAPGFFPALSRTVCEKKDEEYWTWVPSLTIIILIIDTIPVHNSDHAFKCMVHQV